MTNVPNNNKPYTIAPSNYEIYPTKLSIKKGHGVKENDQKAPGLHNAQFINQDNQVLEFYVTDLSMTSSNAWSVAQSRNVQQFFPYNFVQPTLQIKGISRNSYQFNRMSNFVRQSHNLALNGSGSPLVTFSLSPTAGKFSSSQEGFPYNGRTVKGKHAKWFARGYIDNIMAGGRKENHAPEFEIVFTIARVTVTSAEGKTLMDDQTATASAMTSWMEYFWGLSKNDVKKQFYSPPAEPAKKPPKRTPKPQNQPDEPTIPEIGELELGYEPFIQPG